MRAIVFNAFDPVGYWDAVLKEATDPYSKLGIIGLLMKHKKSKYSRTLHALLKTWSQSSDKNLRRIAAAHIDTPESVLRHLQNDPDPVVRCVLAANASVPPPVLAQLAQDTTHSVVAAAIANPSVPTEVLVDLARTGSSEARACIAAQEHCPTIGAEQASVSPMAPGGTSDNSGGEARLKDDEYMAEVRQHRAVLHGLAVRMAGSEADADDLHQDTIVQGYRYLDRFTPGTNLKACCAKLCSIFPGTPNEKNGGSSGCCAPTARI